jgi:hypothetical protein
LYSFKVAGIKGNNRILLHILAVMIMGIIVYFLTQYVYIGRWYELIGISLFGIVLYFSILFIFQEFKKEDFNLFIDTLNVKKMISYIIKELKGK